MVAVGSAAGGAGREGSPHQPRDYHSRKAVTRLTLACERRDVCKRKESRGRLCGKCYICHRCVARCSIAIGELEPSSQSPAKSEMCSFCNQQHGPDGAKLRAFSRRLERFSSANYAFGCVRHLSKTTLNKVIGARRHTSKPLAQAIAR